MILFLDKDEQVVRIQRSVQIKSLEHEQTLGDRYVSNTLHGEIGLMDESILNRIAYIAISSPDQPYKSQYFFLKDHKVERNILSFTGVDTGIEELSKTPIYDRRFRDYRADQIINELLKGTNWDTGYVADTLLKQIQFYYMTIFDALKKLCEACDLEMQFFVETTANGIGKRYIDFKHKLGDNQGSRVVYGKNGIQITKEQERANLYTALIGRGKGEEVSTAEENAAKNGDDIDNARAGYGRKINFEEIVWSKANGDPVDKPAGQRYVEIPEATQQYGYKGIDGQMHPKIGFVDFDEEEDRQTLLQRTYNALKEVAHPQIAFKTSATFLKGNIGDTVRVVRPDLNFDYETRIFHIVWDRRIEDRPRAVTIEFGDSTVNQTLSQHVSASVGSQISQSFDALRENVGLQLDQQMTDYIKNVDGTTNFYSADDPRDTGKVPKINDLWFRPDPDHEGETILYIWNGETWELLVDTSDLEQVNRLIDEQEELLEKYVQDLKALTIRNDKELAEFDKQLEELRQSGVSEEQIDEAIKRAGFDSVEIEEIQRRLDESDRRTKLGSVEIENIRRQLGETSDTAELAVEMIGNDGKTRYSRNRVDGATDGQIEFGGQPLEVTHNGDGFVAGQTYTISFDALCEMLAKVGYTIDFNYPSEVAREVTVKLTPDVEVLDTIERTVTDSFEDELFEGQSYTVVISSDFYKTVTFKVQTAEDLIKHLDLAFKEIVAGDLTSDRILNWDDNPELVIKGVM